MQVKLIADSTDVDIFIRLNIGGTHFLIRTETILCRGTGNDPFRIPLADAYLENNREYYFERSPLLFNVIYQFYITGLIHRPEHLCTKDLFDELDYWCIPLNMYLAPCCCDEGINTNSNSVDRDQIDRFKNLYMGKYRLIIWNLIEKPSRSVAAQIFASLSVLFVLVSILGLILSSIPEFQHAFTPLIFDTPNYQLNNSENASMIETEPLPLLDHIELICIIWFLFEYLLKMLVSYDRVKTFLQILNIIDLLAILPFIIEMTVSLIGFNIRNIRDLKGVFLVIRIMRVSRVVRVLKLGRYSAGLQMFGHTLKASFRQLCMMAMVVLTAVIFFSTLVYFIEKDVEGSQFYSIPAASWW
ncbi:unnamed protein product [Thelazia callipaeda]|uniref:BTB domain-containing protein n=1 Tax=Thelazia callipaeda TaxID=103827 RepID=A0A3P7MPS3_THECL|nr:unnamed protein product [Thelazia callipaeda]